MNKYYIQSYHEIHIDNYKQGQLNYVNSFSLSDVITESNEKSAILKYVEKLGYTIDFENVEIGDEGSLQYSFLVNADNEIPDEQEKKAWNSGNINLYDLDLDIHIYHVIPIVAEEFL